MSLSGTSFAAPCVANLAARLRALDPALTPAATVERIVETGDALASAPSAVIANQARAVAPTREARTRGERTDSAAGALQRVRASRSRT